MMHNGSSSLSAISKGVTEEMSGVHKASGYVFTRNSRTPRHVLLLTAQNSGGKEWYPNGLFVNCHKELNNF